MPMRAARPPTMSGTGLSPARRSSRVFRLLCPPISTTASLQPISAVRIISFGTGWASILGAKRRIPRIRRTVRFGGSIRPATKELVEYFRGDIKVLCTAYIYAHQGRSYYDFDGELFSELIRGNPEFLAGYVHKVAGKQIGRDGWHALNILWQQDDYLKLISIAMECLKNATKPFFTWDSLAEDLLSSPINMPVVNKRRNEWIKYYVEANCYDGESMRFLFGIVCNLPEEQRLPAIVTFCQCNPAFEAFRSIYIIPTHASWSGSEVPILEQHIAFLSEIKDSLIGMQFVEHRAHISEKIRNLQERKEDVLLREFLEER